MIPAVIYARFSSHSQTEQSIEGQLAACYDFAEREGYTVIGEYIDRAISARTDDRPDFQRMIADSAKHTFEAILVYQLDRFSRNRYDSAVNKQKLKKNGVRVVSARENITADASGVLMEAVLEGMAEYYSAELAQKIRRGMDISGSKCLATGGRPALGYKVDETKHYQIDEDTAPTVVKIFEMYASGMTVAQIITELNQQSIKTSTGADFNKNSLRKMLTNKRYIGIYTYKGTETPGGIPRIVSDELFNRVAEMMEKNKKAPARARAKEEYLLTTKLFCGHCREMMTGISGTSKTGTIHNYYTCNGRKKKLCSKKNVQKEYIEDRVIALARAQLTDENISKISKAVAALCEREKESSEYRRLERKRRDIEKQKANLVDALKYGKATETLLNEISKLESSIEGIDRQILMEKAKCLDLKEPEIAFFLTKLRDGDINDITYRRAIIAVMVNAVYLYDDGRLTVIFNSSDRPVEVTEGLLADVEEDAAEFVSGVCRSTISLAVILVKLRRAFCVDTLMFELDREVYCMKKVLSVSIKTIIFFVGWAICVSVIPIPDTASAVIWRFWAELIPLLSVIAITLIFWLADQKKIRLHLTGKPVYNIILGGVTGTIWLGASVGILSILGVVQIEGKNQIAMLWLWLLAAFLNTVMQEMLVRGYLYQMIKSNGSIAAAIIVSTGLFTFAHGGAFEAGILPVLNVITMSLFMTAVLEYTGSLIAPIVIHFLWNGVGAIILGGVSLAEDYPHLFDMTIHGNPILSGGSCKIEGSIIVLFMNLAFLIGFVAAKKRKDRNR